MNSRVELLTPSLQPASSLHLAYNQVKTLHVFAESLYQVFYGIHLGWNTGQMD